MNEMTDQPGQSAAGSNFGVVGKILRMPGCKTIVSRISD